MHVLMWSLQAVFAAVFLLHGLAYLRPPEAMRKMLREMHYPTWFLRFLGVAEILAAFGLVLPGLTGILPWLTPLAAAGLVPILGGAVVFHLSRQEAPQVLVTAAILALLAFVAYARWFLLPL